MPLPLPLFCFVIVSGTNFHPLWNQYTDFTELYSLTTSYSISSVKCLWSDFLLCGLLNLICHEQWSVLCPVFYVQCSALVVVSYAGFAISRQRFWGQIRFDRATLENPWHHTPLRKHRLTCMGNHNVIWLEKSLMTGICGGMKHFIYKQDIDAIRVF